MKKSLIACGLVIGIALIAQATCGASANAFDHEYRAYADVLKRHVRFPHVDYAALKPDRTRLDRVMGEFDASAARGESGWTREQRMAFWINAYKRSRCARSSTPTRSAAACSLFIRATASARSTASGRS